VDIKNYPFPPDNDAYQYLATHILAKRVNHIWLNKKAGKEADGTLQLILAAYLPTY
jgi:hypothetical protein